jgi:hypothetical protein
MKIFRKYFNNLQTKNKIKHFYKNSILELEYDYEPDLAIITIAYNKADLIEIQYDLIKKNITDNYSYFVVDNSSLFSESICMQKFCERKKINYFKIPINPEINNPSMSHGLALNWAIKNIVKRYKISNFALLDHDVFPVKKYTILDKLSSQIIYGLRQYRKGVWYLWPGFAIFDLKHIDIKKMDFLPKPGLDTGGSMWLSLYKGIDTQNMKFAKIKNKFVGEGRNKQKNGYQIIDEAWIHMVNGSNWAGIKNIKKKEMTIKKLLV